MKIMKSNNRLRFFTQLGVALVLAALATLTARAQITWGAAQNIAGDSDVVIAGTLNYAYDWANSAQTVNGVPFAGANAANVGGNLGTTLSSVNNTVYTSGYAPFALLPAEYQGILVGAIYVSSASTYPVTFSNLVSGHLYLVQFWVNDPRNATVSARTDTLGSTGGNSVLLHFAAGGVPNNPGQFAAGLFTALGTTQTLTIVGTAGSVPSMNAVQVRDVTGLNTWGGYQNGTWDYTSANWGTGQSFATLNNVPLVAFTDTNSLGNKVAANVVYIQPAGVTNTGGVVNFLNNTVNYTLQSDPGTPGISGATAVNVLGTGTVTFTGPNTYTNATTIGSGTLVLGSGGSIANSPVILNGGTLNATAATSVYFGSANPLTLNGGVLQAGNLTLDGTALTCTLSAPHPSIATATLTYGAGTSVTISPPRFSSYPAQYPLITYTSFGGGSFDLSLNPLPYGYAGYLSNNVANNSVDMVLTSGLTLASSSLNWDPTLVAGPSDGAGNWSSTVTNWWNGAQTVPWTNSSGIAILGVNTATAYTATITNSVTVGGIVFANASPGAYTIGTSGGSVLNIGGSSPSITLACSNALNVVSAPIVATNGLSALCVTPYETSFGLRFNAATNNIVGSLAVGTPGNASYTTPTGIMLDINGASLNPMVVNLTNVTVYSNASFRISGANSGYTLSPFPQQITLSGDGMSGGQLPGVVGAWDITGNGGGTIAANVVLAGDSTIDFNAGAAGAIFTLNGVISGNGGLQMVCGNSAANKKTCQLTNACTYVGNTIIGGGTTLRLINGNNRLPVTTALTLGISGAPDANWNDYGRLILGISSNAVNQALAGLNCASGIAHPCYVAGGNATNVSVLTVNNTTANYFAGSLGGSAAPANELALVMGGTGNLTLTGTNDCVGGFTVNAGTLTFGDGSSSDSPISGPITNNATVVFNTASSQTYAGVISGAGSVTELGNGVLTLGGANTYTGPTLVSAGKLVLTTASTGAGAVTVTTGAEFDVAPSAAASLTNASLTLGAYAYDNETIGFNFGGNSPGATAPMVVGALTNNGTTSINLLSFGPLSLGSFPLIKYSGYVSNANSSFSLNSLGGGVTAGIQNDAVNHSIDLVVTALNSLKWTGATDTNWDGTTINWLNTYTLTGASYADGDFVRFDDSGNNTAINLTFSPQPGFIVVSNAAKAYSFDGSSGVGGSAELLKQGSGTLTVAVNNNNTGGTFIQKGTLQVGDGISADGNITAPVTDNGALVFNVLNSDTCGGITGTGMVTKAGAGTLTLGSGSAYTGGTLVQAGRLYATDSSALGAGTNVTSVLTGTELWMDQAALTIPQPLVIGGIGVDGTAGAFNVTAAASGSTWSGSIKATANPTVFSAAASTVTLSAGVNGGTNVLTFAPLSGGNFIISSNLTAGTLLLNGLASATSAGGLQLTAANASLTNIQVLFPVVSSSSPPSTDGLWVDHNLALGTNSTVVLTNGQYIGNSGARLGLDNNVTIPASVSLVAYCPGNGAAGVGGYRCSLSVLDSTTNTWNGPITINGADPSLGVTSVFIISAGSSGSSARLILNGNITSTNGVVTLLPRGWSSGQFNGQINLGTNVFSSTDGARWTVASTGNTWGLTEIGSSSSTLAVGTNNALCVSAPFYFWQPVPLI